jgi:ABC-type nitrate/sulfonate/bicarbonate transport system substrate-binding protein
MPTLFAVFLAIFVSQVSVNAAEKIRIGFNPGASGIYFPLAQKMGFLKEEGIEAEVIRLSGGVAVAALASGDADYYTALSSLRAAVQGLPIKLLLLIYKAVSRHS